MGMSIFILMNVLIIPDKFKGSLSSIEVSDAIEKGLLAAQYEPHQITKMPASDGGDGFLDVISHFKNVSISNVQSVDALHRPIFSNYLVDPSSLTAYVELAATVGLSGLNTIQFNKASTYGLGIQILDALHKGCKTIYVGLGGSASNDIGFGMLEAMGVHFLDAYGNKLHIHTGMLHQIKGFHIPESLKNLLEGVSFYAVNDVTNPLVGKDGATHTFGPQKGATPQDIRKVEASVHYLIHHLNFPYLPDENEPGYGAAGGTAFGLKTFLNASFVSGFDFLCEITQLKSHLSAGVFDYIISGEGCFDHTSLQGKLVGGLKVLAEQYNIPLLIVCGQTTHIPDLEISKDFNVLALLDPTISLEFCMNNTSQFIQERVFNYFRS